ncbi:MAG: hypothetical protein WA194_09365 [Patescibacteria group bacterium]
MLTQTEAVIDAIRKNPGITRSQLFDLRVDRFRIANVTARISNARKKLAEVGETIVCEEGKPIVAGRRHVRTTSYFIRPIGADNQS